MQRYLILDKAPGLEAFVQWLTHLPLKTRDGISVSSHRYLILYPIWASTDVRYIITTLVIKDFSSLRKMLFLCLVACQRGGVSNTLQTNLQNLSKNEFYEARRNYISTLGIKGFSSLWKFFFLCLVTGQRGGVSNTLQKNLSNLYLKREIFVCLKTWLPSTQWSWDRSRRIIHQRKGNGREKHLAMVIFRKIENRCHGNEKTF